MKKILWTWMCVILTSYAFAQDLCRVVGWGTQNGGVTGGGSASPTVVRNYTELRNAITNAAVKVIHVNGVITFPNNGRINFQDQTGKTIIGLPGARLVSVDLTSGGSGILYIKRCDNIIIRNIIFEGPGAFDEDGNDNMTIDDCRNVWIDHCDFQDGMDGNLDLKNKADFVSITWCKFSYLKPAIPGGSGGADDHRFSNLIGSGDGATADEGKLNITFQHCWWAQGCRDRMPRVRFGKVHVVNNYFNSSVASNCVKGGFKADILVENNVFENVRNPIDRMDNTFTAITQRNNLFINTTGNTAGSGTAFTPPYSLDISPVANVKSQVTNSACGAGATMDGPTLCGCSSTPNTNPTVSLQTPAVGTSVCRNTNVTLNATAADADGNGTISRVDFFWGNTLVGSDATTPYSITFNASVVGTNNLRAIVYDNAGGTGTSSSVAFTVNALPTASISASGATTFCQGGSVVLTSNAGSTYIWKRNGTTIGTARTFTATTAGNYTVDITDANGCSDASTATVVTVNALPTATISASGVTTFCQGQSVVLTSNAASTYVWKRNGTTIGTTRTFTATTAGNYTVDITDANGCTDASTATAVTVNALPTATISASGATTFCQGGSVVLTSNVASTYVWKRNGTTIGTARTFTATTAGNYTVDITDANGCTDASTVTAVTVNALPTATISASGATTFCQGGSVVLTSNAASTYVWKRNGTSVGTARTFTATTAGNYTVDITDANGCADASTATAVTVNALPTASISASGATTFCQGGSVVLTSNAASTYVWKRNGTSVGTARTFTATTAGNYTVEITDANGCADASTATAVTVNALPTATISASGATTFCQGGSVVLTSNTASTYVWKRNGANVGTARTFTGTTAGNYTVDITDANGCTDASTATAVTVNALPTATISASGATTFCQGGSVVLTSNAASTYIWKRNGTTIGTARTFTATTAGNYTVDITDANGCSDASTATVVTVNALPTATISSSGTTTFCQGGSVVLTSNVASSYVWKRNGASVGTARTFTATTSGNYTVDITDANGCSDASTATAVTVNALPTAIISASGATTFCQGGSVVLTSNVASTYVWKRNGASVGTARTFTATTAGNYTVDITDVNGCSDASTATAVTVNTLPTATISVSGATTFCQGGSVVLTSNAASSYVWKRNGANVGTARTFTATTAGNYNVDITDANGCADASTATTVTVNALPTATISASGATTFCQGGSVVLTSNAAASTYVWKRNGANVGTARTFTATTAGNYTVDITDANGCADASTATAVTVNTLPTATISATGATTFCQGGSVVLTSNAASAYVWKRNGTSVGTARTFTATTAGNYTVDITDANGCSNTSNTTTVTVNALPTPVISVTGATTFCQGGSVLLTSAPAKAYVWKKDGSFAASGYSLIANLSGSYTLSITDANGCQSSESAPIAVSVLDSTSNGCAKPVVGSIVGDTLVRVGVTYTYSIQTISGVTYVWTLPAGATLINGQGTGSIQVQFTSPINGQIQVAATNSNGTTTRTITITISEATITTLATDYSTFKPTIYPNPCQDRISWNLEGVEKVQVWDLQGKIVETSNQRNNTIELGSHIPSGKYILELQGTWGTKKVHFVKIP